MRPKQVSEVMNDPLSQELLHSAIPARMAYNGKDGLPRAIPLIVSRQGRVWGMGTVCGRNWSRRGF